MSDARKRALRSIPSVDELLGEAEIRAVSGGMPGPVATQIVRDVLGAERERVLVNPRPVDRETLVRAAVSRLRRLASGRPTRVINATGIVLHTNLGRAVLGERLATRLADVARGYCDLELDLTTGERGRREDHADLLLRVATGAEASIVVNNCAAAVLLLLDTFARGREVIVSRGEQIEIGGAFRIPDVLARSGAQMVEVGTTNKTRLEDYRRAITDRTAILLKVHTSNYRVVGFTEEASTGELAALARERGLLVIHDLGSGWPAGAREPMPPGEPTLAGEIAAGAHLVAASGDKLLGGPQAGIIVGTAELVARVAKNPLYRALRPGKLTLAALCETLLAHLEGRADADLPSVGMLTRDSRELATAAGALAAQLRAALGDRAQIHTEEGSSETGGGALPARELPTTRVRVRTAAMPAHRLEARLREFDPPVLARVQDESLTLDPRTLLPGDAERVVAALVAALADGMTGGGGDDGSAAGSAARGGEKA